MLLPPLSTVAKAHAITMACGSTVAPAATATDDSEVGSKVACRTQPPPVDGRSNFTDTRIVSSEGKIVHWPLSLIVGCTIICVINLSGAWQPDLVVC